jgi:hypothetical protein
MRQELRALKTFAGLPPNARRAAANWLLALNEADAREQEKRDRRNARRRAAYRRKGSATP